jgi:hypothetical protein
MTEDEAKTKICHRSIDGADSPATVISNEMFAKNFACVGSKCMAWVWVMESYVPKGGDPLATRLPTRPSKNGFCGLAGRP